jgi:hypothetical protein
MIRVSKGMILLVQPNQDSLVGIIKRIREKQNKSSWAPEHYYHRKYYEWALKGFDLVKSGSINFQEEMWLLFKRKER